MNKGLLVGVAAGSRRQRSLLRHRRRRNPPRSPANPDGLKLTFRVQGDGSVVALFPCREVFQSYPETLRGGITSALLDAAMTNALFSIGVAAVTAELVVRFLAPVSLARGAVVIGAIEKTSSHPL